MSVRARRLPLRADVLIRCEAPPLVAPSALTGSPSPIFLSHCRLNVTSALELEFYPIVQRQTQPQRDRELPEKQDSAIFIVKEKKKRQVLFYFERGWQCVSPVSSVPYKGSQCKELE